MAKGNINTKPVAVQVTTWCTETDKDMLSWFYGYRDSGRMIPAAIIRRPANGRVTEGTSVWRFGVNYSNTRDRFLDEYEIVKECHGFTKLVGRP